ncbi:hypothetical protein L210DRAFT_2260583 [Boletus edulis BED1]|uniref:Uncharacterized protein n=1 Tax=Boletus edulis BED1 TaxID=1328754 RepID=A0AAD4GD28_BOLED|nr:hypothetical protein L210DRAFT_2260583 [Boletus edulis BED1]
MRIWALRRPCASVTTHTADMPEPLLPSDPFFAEEAAFNLHAAAEAQFWTTKDDAPGLIVTLPKLGYEFSNGQWVGRDPGGMFSYNSLLDIPIDSQTKFKVTTKGLGRRTFVTVVFYNDKDEVFGRFVGADPAQVAKASGLVGKTGEGEWTNPGIGSTQATFTKAQGTNKARITGISSAWIADFELPEAFVGIKIEVVGDLRYHRENLIRRGAYVRWISDHLIFFEDDVHSHEYTAYVRL